MSALYRLLRPQTFSDLIGQDSIVRILQNSLAQNNPAHAYLFCGSRGLGKTTTARILAKSLLCLKVESNEQPEPCNSCTNCKQIISGLHLDVIEIDAASNRGIDEIRELRDKIALAPSAGKKKIYIIDEVHMLTKEAFNALLKTLEEPPSHAVFILATTEPQKIPATILSRVQRFDFRRPSAEQLIDFLKQITSKHDKKVDDGGLRRIAELADGSYRDCLVLLDQLTAGAKKSISEDDIVEQLGLSSNLAAEQYCQAIESGDKESALKVVDNEYSQGKDLSNFLQLVTEIWRTKLRTESDVKYTQFLELLWQCRNLTSSFSDTRICFELFGSKLELTPVAAPIISANSNVGSTSQDRSSSLDTQTQASTSFPVERTKWTQLIEAAKPLNASIASILMAAGIPNIENNKFIIPVSYSLHKTRLTKADVLSQLATLVDDNFGEKYEIVIDVNPSAAPKPPAQKHETIKSNQPDIATESVISQAEDIFN